MKISDYRQFELEFDCQEVGELLFLCVLDRGDVSLDERWAIEKHLETCADCQKEHEETKFVNDALIANRDYLIQEGVFEEPKPETKFKRIPDEEADFQQFQAKMQRAIARRKKAERQNKSVRSKFAIKITSAVAACLIIALGIGAVLTNNNSGNTSNQQPTAVKRTECTVKIELLTDSGTEIIAAGQPIIATSELKTLRINDNRQMIINIDTELSIIPHNLGCIVKLAKGEIYTEVDHDGKPFIVETIHGRAVITGTTFNIKADDKQMELAVTEGTVSFEGRKGKVNVTAGHKSLLALNTIPTQPQFCDTKKLTAWATGTTNSQEILATTTYQSDFDLSLTFDSAEIDLESIDYKSWIEQKRDWFKQEFPYIFKFKEALAKEGIEVDYPELLIKSGDIWQFAFPEETNTQLIPVNYKSIIKLASAYDKDSKWLSDNLHISQSNLSEDETSNLKALNRWAKALEKSLDSQSEISSKLLMHSLHASVYLCETRILAWLAVSNNKIAITTIEKEATLLEQQIKTTSDCVKQFKQLFAGSYSSSTCDEDKQQDLLKRVIESLNAIMETEGKLQDAQ